MASFDLDFSPRNVDYTSRPMYDCAGDLEVLNSRVLGRADDLQGGFDSAATQFTDVIGWDIKNLSEEDQQHWRDAAVTVTYVASVAEMWADMIEEFKDEWGAQVSDWHNDRRAKEGDVPGKYQDAVITATYPEADGFLWTDWGAGDEAKCRELYDGLKSTRDSLVTREETNWQKLQDNAADIREMLEQGPTPANVQRLIDAGNADWAFYNLDPARFAQLIDENLLTDENAREWAEELNGYWSGDKPLDERYEELMALMAMIGTNARRGQENDTPLNSREVDFLEEFYGQLEEEHTNGDGLGLGILALPGLMAESDMTDEERERALGVLGDGLLALSDPNLGGGYDKLPQSFRTAVESSLPVDYDENGIPYTPVTLGDDLKSLSALLAHTDEDLEAGYGLSTNLHLSMGAFLDNWGDTPDPDGIMPSSEQMAALIDVASRNEDSNYFMLTGTHLNPEPGIDYHDDMRAQALEGTLTYEWHDDGATARQLIDWVHEDLNSDDPLEVSRAGRAFAGFMETLTDPDMHDALVNTGVDVTEGENEYSDASFTQFNGELADGLADIFDAYIYSFADSDVLQDNEPVTGVGNFEPGRNFVSMGPEERAMYMQLLMGNDETAGRVVNSVDVYQQIEAAAYFESGQDEETARGGGQLQALLEEALRRESADRTADLDEQIDRETQITEFIVGEATGLSEKIPVIGAAVAKGLELGQDSIVEAIVDGEYEVSPRHPDFSGAEYIERNFRIEALDHLSQHDPEALNDVIRPDEFHTLIDGGALTVWQDGVRLTAEDIGEDFVFDDSVRVSVEKDPNEWTDNENQDLDRMDGAISNIMDDVEVTTSDGRTQPGHQRVGDFVEQYNNSYNDTNSVFEGREEEEEE
ncbi:hypothetical protein KIK06_20705 [Nocardiopsis sp. EMB25]|uniref:TPR repeat region-containing protein n=1 Tax=Nocardiopsis sp. EMB25 TaxID=2835867 RepID=UPI002284709B|nr:hypothetical protein [Nocardiopsis sp. EMB25]MCY9786318.1 hypothetical protein [Nocardiopsis sp. EMB25]